MLGLMTPAHVRAASVDVNDDWHWTNNGINFRAMTRSGVTVDEEIALTYEAVFAATRVLAEPFGTCPLVCYERAGDSDRRVASLPVADLFALMVNYKMTAGVFLEGRAAHQVNWGGGFAEVEFFPGSDRIRAFWPIHPSRIMFSRADPENYPYLVRSNTGEAMPMAAREMLHFPGALCDDGVWGRGLINYGRNQIGMGLATERAGEAFFGSGGQPKGVIEIPGMQDRQKRAAFREEWRDVHGQPERNEPTVAIVNPGSKYTPISLTNEANQMIQTRQVNKSNIATLYKIPGYKINAEDKETAGTIEQKAIEFLIHSVLPWGVKQEQQLAMKCLTPEQQRKFYFEYNFAALLRGDPVARYTAYRIGMMIGLLTINECRRLENLNNIGPAGDQHFVPANLTTAERALSGDFGDGGAMGSDHNGLPGEQPTKLPGDATSRNWVAARANPTDDGAFDAFTRTLGKTKGSDTRDTLAAFARELPERSYDHVEVARQALLDVLSRMFHKEANAAARAAKTNNDFAAWLREFYAEHRALMADALRTPCNCLRIAGVHRWADRLDLAEWLIAASVRELTSMHNSDSPTVFSRKLAEWPTSRAERIADEILATAKPACVVRIEAPQPSPLERAVESLVTAQTAAASAAPAVPPPNIVVNNIMPPRTNEPS